MKFKLEKKVHQLWSGCILGSLAHAIMVAQHPLFSYEQSWDGVNYCLQDGAGIRGTVTFAENGCVAAFRNDRYFQATSKMDVGKFFQGADADILSIAEKETLQYLLDDINGEIRPAVTAVFWGHENLYTNDSIEKAMMGGLSLLEKQFMDYEQALLAWISEYSLNDSQANLLERLYEKKVDSPSELIIVGEHESEKLNPVNEEGLEESAKLFEELGFQVL